MSDIWEPWSPRVGQRVRVRISPECRMNWRFDGDGLDWHPTVIGHLPSFSGVTGVVNRIASGDWPWLSHPYGVRFDRPAPCVCDGDPAYGGWFAAIELEPLRFVEAAG